VTIVRLKNGRLRPGRILLIDDDPDDCEIEAYDLRNAGYHVVTATSVTEGLESALGLRPDVILCSMNPDSLWFVRQCKANPRMVHVPILGMAHYLRSSSDERLALAVGFSALLHKPLSIKEFLREVDRFHH
jgi:CheY-like chemotaxis protein